MSTGHKESHAEAVGRWYREDGSLEHDQQLLDDKSVKTFYRVDGTIERVEELFYHNGKLVIELYNEQGKPEDLPDGTAAVRSYFANGVLDYENHYVNGVAGHILGDDTPYVRNYHPSGSLKGEYWASPWIELTCRLDGTLERCVLTSGNDLLTFTYRPDGSIDKREYGSGSRPIDPPDHRPAVRAFRPDGSVEYEEHYNFFGELDDPPGGRPAVRWFNPDGTIRAEGHYRHGVPSKQHSELDCEACRYIDAHFPYEDFDEAEIDEMEIDPDDVF